MAVIHPRIHWGTREVDWTWVPETTDEITGVARRMAAEAMGVLGFVFFAGAAIIVNSKVSEGGLGLLGMAAATGVAYALMVYMFHPVSGGHLNPAVTLGELALGLIVSPAFLVASPLTGAALNLSRVFGTALVANEWPDFGGSALGTLGGAVAGFAYEYVFQSPDEPEERPAEA